MPDRKLSVTEFKAHCTEALREVETTGEILRITRHGRVIALIVPARGSEGPKSFAEWLGSGKGTVAFAPDFDPGEPASAPEEWEALKGEETPTVDSK
jgi:prevent-host-death family protein